MHTTKRIARRRAFFAAHAVCLAVALLSFTAIYRNSSAFSAANPTRCHSLSSGEHGGARALFNGDFGPLCVVAVIVALSPEGGEPVLAVEPSPAPAHSIALITSPDRRPPPVSRS